MEDLKIRHPQTIRFKLSLYYGILLLLLLSINAGITFYLVTRSEARNISEYGKTLLQQTSDSIDSELKIYEVGLWIINNNELFQNFAKEKHSEYKNEKTISIRSTNDLFGEVMGVTNVIGDVNSIGIFLREETRGYFLGNASAPQISEDYYEFVLKQYSNMGQDSKITQWAGPVDFQNTSDILLMHQIIDNQNLEKLGVLVLNYDVSNLERMLRQTELGKKDAVFLLDSEGNLVGSSDRELYESWKQQKSEKMYWGHQAVTIENEQYLVVSKNSQYTGWSMTGLIALDQLRQQMFINQITTVLTALLGILLSVIITVVIARHLAQPMERLRFSMQEVAEEKNMDVVYEDDTFYETQELGKSFVKMIYNIDELVIKNKESELREKEAQLSALQAQINPHFLYNTLNTINYMLILENKPEIGKLVVNLGDLLRSSIEGVKGEITVEEEIALVEKYLYIQKARFGDKLNYEIQVSEQARKCFIICLLLQPLVENVIIHGFEKCGGTVYIRGDIDAVTGHLLLTVEDDGQGMSEEKAASLLIEEKESQTERKHIGVANVNQRIKIYYGNMFGITVESELNKGTKIRIKLPCGRRR